MKGECFVNYTVPSIKIKSEWFEELNRKMNVYQKITYKGLNLYFQLYKFRIHNQQNDHTFITSLSLLRKETGYSTEEVLELLKKLKRAKIIKMENLSRWDYLYDENNRIIDNHILIITAADAISLYEYNNDGLYIYVPLELFDLYNHKGLNERYYPLYCLIKKMTNNTENKCWMSIEKMSDILKFDKGTIHKMIYTMNKHYLLCSERRKRKDKDGYFFEHVICDSANGYEKFKNNHQEQCDKLLRRKVKANMYIEG